MTNEVTSVLVIWTLYVFIVVGESKTVGHQPHLSYMPEYELNAQIASMILQLQILSYADQEQEDYH